MKDYIPLKEEITKIVNQIDPWDLISAGAPQDEYNGYVNGLVSLIVNHKFNRENLEAVLSNFKNKEVTDKIFENLRILNLEWNLSWEDLQDAYGSATEIPNFLETLSKDTSNKEAWFELWSRLCHQGDVYSASYATVPVIAKIARETKYVTDMNMNLFLLPACIEIARLNNKGPSLDNYISDNYLSSISLIGQIATTYLNSDNNELKRSAEVAHLISLGKVKEAEELLA